jgi:predicted RNA binding protein YcfA (HicA-like mRNA interferase family)
MPRKIRGLVRDLERAGFLNRGGKGSHRNFLHPHSGARITVSGKDSDDAKPYQESEVAAAIKRATNNAADTEIDEAGT